MMTLEDLTNSILTCAQIITAVFLFARSLPLREPRGSNLAAATACFLAWSVFTASVVPLSLVSELPVLLAGAFTLALLLSVLLTLLVFDASVWAALFCATAGYTMQNLASGLGSSLHSLLPEVTALLPFPLMMIVPYAAIYGACYLILISRVEKGGLELMRPQAMLPMMITVIAAVIVYDVIVKQAFDLGGLPVVVLVAMRLSHALLCAFILVLEYELLYNRRLQHEMATVQQIMEDEKEQYQLSKETIEAINLKCHDIRHQIRRLGSGLEAVSPDVIDEIAREVNVYDSAVRTGNEPLDVILTEKSLVCSREDITLTCIADGQCLSPMVPSDIYSLMGNALDNAIEAARRIDDRERRSISLLVRRSGNTAIVHVENYFAGSLEFRDGLPRTTKADRARHGFGMKSMQLIAARYGGALHARAQGNVFHLNVAIPLPE